jgi:hypothetical protein
MQTREIGLLGLGVVLGIVIGAYVLPKVLQQKEIQKYSFVPTITVNQGEVEEEARRRLVTID